MRKAAILGQSASTLLNAPDDPEGVGKVAFDGIDGTIACGLVRGRHREARATRDQRCERGLICVVITTFNGGGRSLPFPRRRLPATLIAGVVVVAAGLAPIA